MENSDKTFNSIKLEADQGDAKAHFHYALLKS